MDNDQITRFTMLWTQTQNSVLAFISSTVRDFSDADDVLQSVARVAVSKFDGFDRTGDTQAFVKWVITVARYEVLAFLRDQSRDRHEFMSDAIGEIAQAFVELAPEFGSRQHALSQCLQKLQDRSRDVLEKRYAENLKTDRIAELTGLSPNNVSMILNRAYKTLRLCIESRMTEAQA